ncbi:MULTISPECIES: hypothetical protein [Providencia]|uniref:hypothetical protein n=2 Tax=Morganellaceae TaxID=1903414 RepID=UPI000839060F|nr:MULTISPECIES: hypothetical protein [Providencia]MBP6123958.1 hypothetical protein [Providencia sp.]NIH20896.1 hypothetical protein [Providencia heimbachae]
MKTTQLISHEATTLTASTKIKPESLHEKASSKWQSQLENKKDNNINAINLSIDEQESVNQFIQEFKSCNDPKSFFLCLFKKMINLKKDDKKNFIAGTMQQIQSPNNPELNYLKEKFNKALYRYMSINLMTSPLMEHFSNNMNNFSIDANDDYDDDDIEYI